MTTTTSHHKPSRAQANVQLVHSSNLQHHDSHQIYTPSHDARSIYSSPSQHCLTTPSKSERGASIIGDRTEYIERTTPKKVMREKKVKKKMMIPTEMEQEIQKDEIIEIKEKIIEVAVTPPEVAPTVVYNDIVKERKVKQVEYIDKKVPKVSYKERIVEVPKIEYVDKIHENVVKVPRQEERVVYKEVKVPQYVDRPVPVHVQVDHPIDVHRRVPVTIEAVQDFTFELPTLKPKYKRKELPIYAPRFVEVPVPAELMDMESQKTAVHLREQIHLLAAQEAPSLVEVEKIAKFAKEVDFQSHISHTDYQKAIENAWRNQQLTVQNGLLRSIGSHK